MFPRYGRLDAYDIEGTITHDFMTEEKNNVILKRILNLRETTCLIIDTAGDYNELLKHYPFIRDVLDEICIIANCGKKLILYGRECVFWQNYEESLFGPSEELINKIEEELRNDQYSVEKWSIIDKLYINGKVQNVTNETIASINNELKDTNFCVCCNKNNLKIISTEINKGNTLLFILKNVLMIDRTIGAGNNVLDIMFLKYCDKAYLINNSFRVNRKKFISLQVYDEKTLNNFVEKLEGDVCQNEFY